MSKINELKQHYPYFNVSLIDILSKIFEKPKYVEMATRLIKDKFSTSPHLDEVKGILIKEFELSHEIISSFSVYEILSTYIFLDNIGRINVTNLKKFVDYNERKLINQSDVTTYKSFDEIKSQISLAELKLVSKELQAQTEVLHDSDEWLVLKPLSFEASLKYGASTKWCTAMKNDPEYFIRYSKRGIVIYCINRSTGDKVAAFKNLNTDYEYETSFWDVKDIRLDSMETNLPEHILNIIRGEFNNTKLTNWELFPEDYKNKQFSNYEKLNQPTIPENVGGLGLAVRNAITYNEAFDVEEPFTMQIEDGRI
jgi:hypothetical protein